MFRLIFIVLGLGGLAFLFFGGDAARSVADVGFTIVEWLGFGIAGLCAAFLLFAFTARHR